MENDCQRIEELLAAFALDALEFEEKFLVEAHQENCARCRRALTDYQVVSDGLMTALPPVQPPARIRAQLLTKTAPDLPKPSWTERWRAWLPQVMVTSALAVIFVLVIFNVNLFRRTNQILEMQEEMAQQNQAYQTTFALLTYPDSQVVVIDDGVVYGTLVYDPDGQIAVLNVWGLETLPDGQDYQVWLIEADQTRINGGVFQSSEQSEYVSFIIESPTSFESFVGLGVTVEPTGGSPGPTGPRIFGTEL
jgi:anti-sigma-K factor RskA